MIIEFILTFVFVITVIGVTSKPEYKSVSGIVIGLSLAAVHLWNSFTGTGVNPARSFGPALARAVKWRYPGTFTGMGIYSCTACGSCCGSTCI